MADINVRSAEHFYARYPGLSRSTFAITSPETCAYNCIAWAAGDTTRWWGPDDFPEGVFYWPEGVLREDTVESWVAAFSELGFVAADTAELERNVEKIAIFALDGSPRHVARQLPTGVWTSKMGKREDVQHDLLGLVGNLFGDVVQVMRRTVS